MSPLLARLWAFLAAPFVRSLEAAVLAAIRPIVAAEAARFRHAVIDHLEDLGDQLAHRATVDLNPNTPLPGAEVQPDGTSPEIGVPGPTDAGPYEPPDQADRDWWSDWCRRYGYDPAAPRTPPRDA